jgi:hypothetical protein
MSNVLGQTLLITSINSAQTLSYYSTNLRKHVMFAISKVRSIDL